MNAPKNNAAAHYPVALSLSALHADNRSGIGADLRDLNAFAVYGLTVATEVGGIVGAPETLTGELQDLFKNFYCDAVKCGKLSCAQAAVVADFLTDKSVKLVIDATQTPSDTLKILLEKLTGRPGIWLFDLKNVQSLTGETVNHIADLSKAAAALSKRTQSAVLIHGFHTDGESIDCALVKSQIYLLKSPYLAHCPHQHGAADRYSAALTALLAAGEAYIDALQSAKTYVLGSLNEPIHLGPQLDGAYPPEMDYSDAVEVVRQ